MDKTFILKHESILTPILKSGRNWVEIKKLKVSLSGEYKDMEQLIACQSKSAVHTAQDCLRLPVWGLHRTASLHQGQLRAEATLISMLVDAINQQGDFTVEGFCENATQIFTSVCMYLCVWTYVYIKKQKPLGPRASTSLVAYYSSSN